MKERVVAVHADLGRMEHPGTVELAARQAAHYGVKFEVVRREQGDLLDHVRKHGKWPGPTTRYCTADHKRGPVLKLLTALTRRRVFTRVLQCLGMRAEESTPRSKLSPFTPATRTVEGKVKKTPGTSGRKAIDVWLPIHGCSTCEVWKRIREGGAEPHPAYEKFPRVSCRFCFFMPRDVLMRSGLEFPDLLDEYVWTEKKTGHSFQARLSLASVQEALARGERPGELTDWRM